MCEWRYNASKQSAEEKRRAHRPKNADIDERHLLFHSIAISAAEREETHGNSEIIFRTMHLLRASIQRRSSSVMRSEKSEVMGRAATARVPLIFT